MYTTLGLALGGDEAQASCEFVFGEIGYGPSLRGGPAPGLPAFPRAFSGGGVSSP